ncbi:RNA-binding protein MEX3B-like [Sipha flava]|uniref:RNA-binding protein MEX3B-like n=1 Tax=Sipha flava TaxID=143950 RepID=A0A8B8FDP9_9HEMI|nr:RNA-binding protein MEX3B-like [Sipha flava]
MDVLELCTICFEEVVVVRLNPCDHQYCIQCVTRMMEENYNICYLCRNSISRYEGYNI